MELAKLQKYFDKWHSKNKKLTKKDLAFKAMQEGIRYVIAQIEKGKKNGEKNN